MPTQFDNLDQSAGTPSRRCLPPSSRSDRRLIAPAGSPMRPAACRLERPGGERHARTPHRTSPETRWQRWLRSLLYGRDVDREAKARARLGLAIVAFVCIYAVIALRLVHVRDRERRARRPPQRRPDIVATARPDILDRNGEDARDRRADAVAVRRAAQAHRRRRGGGTADRRPARPQRQRNARAAVLEERLRLAEARNHAKAAAGDSPARHSRHRLPRREQARLSERARRSRT